MDSPGVPQMLAQVTPVDQGQVFGLADESDTLSLRAPPAGLSPVPVSASAGDHLPEAPLATGPGPAGSTYQAGPGPQGLGAGASGASAANLPRAAWNGTGVERPCDVPAVLPDFRLNPLSCCLAPAAGCTAGAASKPAGGASGVKLPH